ncbi:MAG: HEPN domain-containing protein [Chitinophagaceae bacterium]|nr:HEPN domain-containing protein [Chitinophagaceae bacterium]
MSPEKKEIIGEWFEKADEDILTAEVVIEASPKLFDVAAFHAQQAAEKYLKAFLVFKEIMPPRVHNIKMLIDIAVEYDKELENLREAETLSKYAIRSRYPDDMDVDSKEQVLLILDIAKSVRDFVKNKIVN